MLLLSSILFYGTVFAITIQEGKKDGLLQFAVEKADAFHQKAFSIAVKNFVESEDNETELPLLLAAIDADTQLSVIKDCGEELVLATEDLKKSSNFSQAQKQFIALFVSTEILESTDVTIDIHHFMLHRRLKFYIWQAAKKIDEMKSRSLSRAFQNLLFLGAPPAHLALVFRVVLGPLKHSDIEYMKIKSIYGEAMRKWAEYQPDRNYIGQFIAFYGYEDNAENLFFISKYFAYVARKVVETPDLLLAYQNFVASGSPVQDLVYFLRAASLSKPSLPSEVEKKIANGGGDQVTQNWMNLMSISQEEAKDVVIDLYTSVEESDVVSKFIRVRLQNFISNAADVDKQFLKAYKNYYREKLSVDDHLLMLAVFGNAIQRSEIIANFYSSAAFGRAIKGWVNLSLRMKQPEAQYHFVRKYLNVLPLPKKYIALDSKIEDSDLKNAIELYDQSGDGFEDPWLAVKCLVNLASYYD